MYNQKFYSLTHFRASYIPGPPPPTQSENGQFGLDLVGRAIKKKSYRKVLPAPTVRKIKKIIKHLKSFKYVLK